MSNQTTKEEWHACGLLIKVGSIILAPSGVILTLVGFYLQQQSTLFLYILITAVILGALSLIAGFTCKLAWKRRYARKP